MARVLRMPEVAANATEAVLAEWLVAETGDFAVGDAIATVETEKALVDVEAEAAGTVLATLVLPGSAVDVGAPIAVLGDPGEQVPTARRCWPSWGWPSPWPRGCRCAATCRSPASPTSIPARGRRSRRPRSRPCR